MEYVNPSFLYGLFAIAIPIIIHLFNFRKFKKVAFTNVQFLKEVKEETQSKSKLKHLLILLSRILAIIFLVLAFAQPFIPAKKTSTYNKNAISIFIDNSFSMDSEGEIGRLLDVAKKYASDIAMSYSTTDKFQIVTNDFSGKNRHFFNRDEFIELIHEVESSPHSRTLSEVLQRQTTDLKEMENFNKAIYYLSDFQKSTTDINKLIEDSTSNVNFVPILSNSQHNLYIDSIWFESPIHQTNQTEILHVKIVNTSDKDHLDIPLKITINGEQKALTSFSVEGNENIDSTLIFTNTKVGIMNCKVEIQDYPITYDDELFFSYKVADSIPVLYVFDTDTNQAIKSVLENDPLFKVTYSKLNNIDYSQLSNQAIIILESLKQYSTGLISELGKFTSNGKSIFIIPNPELDHESYKELSLHLRINSFLDIDTSSSKVSSINLEDVFYNNVFENIPKNIDLPLVKSHFRTSSKTVNAPINLLMLKDGSSFLNKYTSNTGTIYTLSSPLENEFTNFTKHAIFVPTLYKMILLSSGKDKLYYTIGRDNYLTLPSTIISTAETIHITSSTEFDVIPETRKIGFKTDVFLHDQITVSGNYNLAIKEESILGLGFNYDKSESLVATYTSEELEEIIANEGITAINIVLPAGNQIASSLKTLNEGTSFWKICIMLTLLFFGIEILLIKFWTP